MDEVPVIFFSPGNRGPSLKLPRELLARDGTYARLWNLQLQEQEEEEQRLKAVGSELTSTT